MAVERDIALNVLGRVADYRAKMSELPGITEREAAKSALKLQAEMTKAARQTAKAQQQAAAQSARLWKDLVGAALAAVSVQAVKQTAKAVLGMRHELSQLTNQMGDLSAGTGIGTQTLNALRVAAEVSGGELAELEAGLKGFPKRLDDFRRGTGEALPVLEALGFQSDEASGMLGDMDGATRDIIERLQGVEDPGRRAAMATALWGDSGVRLMQVLGDRSLDQWVQTASLGVDMSEANVRAAQEWQVSVTLLSNAWQGAQQAALEALDVDGMVRTASSWLVGLGTVVTEYLDRGFSNAAKAVVAMKAAVTGDLSGALMMLKRIDPAKDMRELAAATREAMDAFRAEQEVLTQGTGTRTDHTTALTKTTDERKREAEAIQLQTDALQTQYDVMTRVGALQRSLTDDLMSDADRVEQAHQDRLDAIWELAQAAQEAGIVQLDVSAMLHEAEQRRMRELAELYRQTHREQVALAQDAWELDMQRHAAATEAARQRAAEEQALTEQVFATMADTYSNAEALLMAAASSRSKTNKQAAKQMVRTARGAALFGVGVETAAAVMKGYAMFGPPPSPLGVLASVNALAAGVAQGAAIASQPMPTFFGGTSRTPGMGEVMVAAHPNEAMLNSMARRNMGDDVINAINAGLEPLAAMGGGGGGGDVLLDGMLVGKVQARRARRGGDPLRSALVGQTPVGYRNPHRGT